MKNKKNTLIDILDRIVDDPSVMDLHYDQLIDQILQFYSLKKKKIEKNELYYKNLLVKLEERCN